MTLEEFAHVFPNQFEVLRAAYGEPHRAYHNWAHVEALDALLMGMRESICNSDAMLLSLLYHDCVYDPASTQNETDSADQLRAALGGAIPDTVISDAEEIIRATETHTVPEGLRPDLADDCALFLDCDLSILGVNEVRFDAYEAAIRQEYAVVPDDLYRAGRRAILERFLARPVLYFTPVIRDALEAQARANLTRSIAKLR